MAYTLSMSVGFTAVFKKVPEGYAAYVEELPGEALDRCRSIGALDRCQALD
jgi:hypothetical protein